MMDTVVPETCWAYKKHNKIISDIYLVFYSSVITMMHGPTNIKISPEFAGTNWKISRNTSARVTDVQA